MHKPGIILTLLLLVVQIALLPQTGMTWDEPASWFIGRANLKFWQTGNRKYLEDVRNPALFAGDPIHFIYGEELYPPVAFVLQSAASYILAEKLQLISVIDAHHLGEVLLGVAGAWAFYEIGLLLGWSTLASILTTLIYATYPTIFGQMRSDAKDVPLMSMLTIVIYVFLRWMQSWQGKKMLPRIAWAVGLGLALGLAQGTKPTAAIIVPVLGLWWLVSVIISKDFRQQFRPLSGFLALLPLVGLVAIAIFVVSWPWLWSDLPGRLTVVANFFRVVGHMLPVQYFGVEYRAGVDVPWHYPFGVLAVQTPILVLLLGAGGLIAGVNGQFGKKLNVYRLLPIIWFTVGIGRFLVPGMIIYAKVRHFIDAMPGFFLIVGMGINLLLHSRPRVLSRVSPRRAIGLTICLIIFLQQALINFRLYPYEAGYFNFLVGGLRGVAEKGLFDAEYWAGGVKEAMDYIKSQDSRTTVYACMLRHLAHYYRAPGMQVTADTGSAQYAIVPNSVSIFAYPRKYYETYHRRVYTVTRDGAELFFIYKYQNPVGWMCGQETEMVD